MTTAGDDAAVAALIERVRTHLRAQGRRALRGDGECAYRAADGSRCAVGCLIADGAYDRDMEGAGMHAVDTRHGSWEPSRYLPPELEPAAAALAKALNASRIPATRRVHDTLGHMQRVHDRSAGDDWEERLRELTPGPPATAMPGRTP